jgi:hypothetical protein
MRNLFKSEQLLETEITPKIEEDEVASSMANVYGKYDKRPCGCPHDARNSVAGRRLAESAGGIPIAKS